MKPEILTVLTALLFAITGISGRVSAGNGVPAEVAFVRGDANADGGVNIADATFILNFVFLGGPLPPCLKAADANDDGRVNIADPSRVLRHVFLGAPPPPAPSPDCGMDPTQDSLSCLRHVPCGDPGGTELPFETISRDASSGAPEQVSIFRNADTWSAFWAAHTSIFFPPFPRPEIDFSREFVVVVLRHFTSGGYHVKIDALTATPDEIRIAFTRVEPSFDCPTTDAPTQPHHIVRVPWVPGAPVPEETPLPVCCDRPTRATGVGDCEKLLGWAWNGQECVALGGCSCAGEDCDSLFPSPDACRAAYNGCR